jgi:polar amino acid transport system substrate-binding protein
VRFRNYGAVLMAGALAIALAACGGDDDDSSSGATTTAASGATTTAASGATTTGGGSCTPAGEFEGVNADTLTVVTSLPGPGFWVGSATDPNQIKAGYEYDMAVAIKDALCLAKLDVRNESFDAIVAGTVQDYDIVLSQTTITDERKQVVDFTEPYFESQQGVLAKAGTKMTTLDEAKAAKWGVQTGTTAFDLLELIKPSSDPQVYQQLADAYTALDAGQVDAVLIDTAINLGQAAASDGKLEVIAQFEQPSGPDQYGAITPKGSTNLATFDKIIADLKASGKLKEFAEKNLSKDPGDIPVISVS